MTKGVGWNNMLNFCPTRPFDIAAYLVTTRIMIHPPVLICAIAVKGFLVLLKCLVNVFLSLREGLNIPITANTRRVFRAVDAAQREQKYDQMPCTAHLNKTPARIYLARKSLSVAWI